MASIHAQGKTYETVFIDLSTANCSPREMEKINKAVRNSINTIKNCNLISGTTVGKIIEKNNLKTACYDIRCAVQIAKPAAAGRVIYGTVNRAVTRYDQRLGAEGPDKYLLAEKKREHYVITLNLADAEKNVKIATIYEAALMYTLDRDSARAAAKLGKYYASGEEETARSAEPDKTPEKRLPPVWHLYAGLSGFVSMGSFRSMSNGGAGVGIGAGVSNLIFNNSLVRLQARYHYAVPAGKTIECFHDLELSAVLGYSFSLPAGFSLTPVLGAGYVFHFLSNAGMIRFPGMYLYSKRNYNDPHLFVSCEAAYHFDERYALFISPEYFLFFEKNAIGMRAGATLGFRYSF